MLALGVVIQGSWKLDHKFPIPKSYFLNLGASSTRWDPPADERKPAPSAAKQRASAPARTACEADRKWVVEHHLDNHDIVLGDTNPRQTVYIFGCRNCTVQARPTARGVPLAPCNIGA